jgi:hypothetical protein
MIALFLPSLAVPLVVLNPHLHGMYETLLVLAAFGLAFWRMWRETGSEQVSARPVKNGPAAARLVEASRA